MNPLAGPSGPSKYSTRTDNLTMGSTYYGEGVETSAIKAEIPVSKTTGVADDVGGRPRNPLTPITPLFATSERPEEAITSGVDISKGVGSSALMMSQMSQQQSLSQTLAEMLPYDTNGEIAALYEQALSRGL
jgi:hypothetical protein